MKIFKPTENNFSEQIEFLKNNFPKVDFKEKDVDDVLSFISSDKKNIKGIIKPVLLKRMGKPYWEKEVTIDLIRECLNYYNQL